MTEVSEVENAVLRALPPFAGLSVCSAVLWFSCVLSLACPGVQMVAAVPGFTSTYHSTQKRLAPLSQIIRSPEFYPNWTNYSAEEVGVMLIHLGLLKSMLGIEMVGQFHSDLCLLHNGRGERWLLVGSGGVCGHECPLQGQSLSHREEGRVHPCCGRCVEEGKKACLHQEYRGRATARMGVAPQCIAIVLFWN